MAEDDGSFAIRRSRFSAAIVLTLCLGFILLTSWLVFGELSPRSRYSHEYARLVGVVGLALSAWASVGPLLTLIRPGYLRLSAAGFRYEGWLRGPETSWQNVEAFKIVRVSGTKFVEPVLRTSNLQNDELLGRRLIRTTLDGYAFAGLGLKAESLLQTLEDWRRKHASDLPIPED
jgi:hypothetical protein